MTVGRPPKWNSPQDLEDAIESYFEYCDEHKKMPTKAGLSLHIDTPDSTLHDYEKKDGFSEAIKRAYKIIEDAWTQNLAGNNATGSIFYLKAAFHYKDRVDVTTNDKELPVPIYGGNSKE